MENIGLVLQGGGMRGVYTSGVLDFFMERNLYFPYVIGVSAGACNGSAYVARQMGFGRNMLTKYINNKTYMGFRSLYKNGSFFDMDYIFREVPKVIEPLNFGQFYNSKEQFVAVATNCYTGKPEYFTKHNCKDILRAIQASSSIPFLCKTVSINGIPMLDGGVSDPIPIKKSIDDGNEKNVIILTRPLEYEKKSPFLSWLVGKVYKEYKGLCSYFIGEDSVLNETVDYIKSLIKEDKVFVIEPSENINIRSTGRNTSKLNTLYEIGYKDGQRAYEDIMSWIEKEEEEHNIFT